MQGANAENVHYIFELRVEGLHVALLDDGPCGALPPVVTATTAGSPPCTYNALDHVHDDTFSSTEGGSSLPARLLAIRLEEETSSERTRKAGNVVANAEGNMEDQHSPLHRPEEPKYHSTPLHSPGHVHGGRLTHSRVPATIAKRVCVAFPLPNQDPMLSHKIARARGKQFLGDSYVSYISEAEKAASSKNGNSGSKGDDGSVSTTDSSHNSNSNTDRGGVEVLDLLHAAAKYYGRNALDGATGERVNSASHARAAETLLAPVSTFSTLPDQLAHVYIPTTTTDKSENTGKSGGTGGDGGALKRVTIIPCEPIAVFACAVPALGLQVLLKFESSEKTGRSLGNCVVDVTHLIDLTHCPAYDQEDDVDGFGNGASGDISNGGNNSVFTEGIPVTCGAALVGVASGTFGLRLIAAVECPE